MEKGIYTNRICVYSSIFLMLLVQAFGIATGNYIIPALVYVVFIFIYLFYINKTVLIFLILSARIILDSIPFITYPKLVFGLSFMEYFTLGLMIFMFTYLLVYKGIELDAISKSMILILAAMLLTTVCHGNIADLIEVGSLWLYFILVYLFFKYLLHDITIKHILNIIVFTSLYPFFNQLYSIIIGAGKMHLGYARYAGTYHHPHNVADYLFFAIPAALYLFMTERRLKMRYIYIGAIALLHIGIFMAGYRTNWIAVFVFWAFYILFVSRRKLVSILLLSLVSIISWNFVGEMLSTKMMPVKTILENPAPLFNLEDYKYNRLLSGRIGLWKGAVEQYLHSEFIEKIIGLGLGSANRIRSLYMHNEYLSALVENGVAGLGMLIVWIYFGIKTLFRFTNYNKHYFYLILATFISFLVIAFGTMPFRHVIVLNYMAIYFATTNNKSIIESIVDVDETS